MANTMETQAKKDIKIKQPPVLFSKTQAVIGQLTALTSLALMAVAILSISLTNVNDS